MGAIGSRTAYGARDKHGINSVFAIAPLSFPGKHGSYRDPGGWHANFTNPSQGPCDMFEELGQPRSPSGQVLIPD